MEEFLKLFEGKAKPKLGPAKNAEMIQILDKAVEGVYPSQPKTLKADVARIQTHIRRLEKEADLTGVRASRIEWLRKAQHALEMLATPVAVPAKAPAPAPAAAPAAAAPPPPPPPPPGQLFPVKTKKTREDGDCFYSSMYRASNEQGALHVFHTCLGIDTTSEDTFILSFRQRVANEILSNHLPSVVEQNGRQTNTYDMFMLDDPATYEIKLEGFPSWFATEFATQEAIGEREHFLTRLAFHAGSSYKDVGEIEVKIVQRLLEPCPLLLDIRVDTPPTLAKVRNGKPVITLQNQGESHYEYFSFNIPQKLSRKVAKGGSTHKGSTHRVKTRRTRR